MPSTDIRRFSYDDTLRELLITFNSGRRYVYFKVPPEVAADFKAAFSKGTFFNAYIRDYFNFDELESVTP